MHDCELTTNMIVNMEPQWLIQKNVKRIRTLVGFFRCVLDHAKKSRKERKCAEREGQVLEE